MGKAIAALAAGLVCGLGLTISQMVNPAKVVAFLDIFGDWDPSLALVMGGAVIVTFIGYRLVWLRKVPLLAPRFERPIDRRIGWRLATGAVLFGAGWGLVGLCPGPAISALGFGGWPALGFLAAMAAGMGAFALVNRGRSAPGECG
jgi:uncharacterized membrane protein YedE/YeeE